MPRGFIVFECDVLVRGRIMGNKVGESGYMASKKKFKKYSEINFDDPTRKDFLALVYAYLTREIYDEQFTQEMYVYFVRDSIDQSYFSKTEWAAIEELGEVCSEYVGDRVVAEDEWAFTTKDLEQSVLEVVKAFKELANVKQSIADDVVLDGLVYLPVNELMNLPFAEFVHGLNGQVNVVDSKSEISALELAVSLTTEEEYSAEDTLKKIEYLLANGAQLDLLQRGGSLLHRFVNTLFITKRDVSFVLSGVELLLRYGVDVNARDSFGASVVYQLLSNEKVNTSAYINVYKCFLETGFDYLGNDYHGSTTLECLRELPQGEQVMLLIPEYGKFLL